MKIKEIITPEHGIFDIFADRHPDEYAKLFDGVSAHGMNVLFISCFGEKEALPWFTTDKIMQHIPAVIDLHLYTWMRIYAAIHASYEVNQGAGYSESDIYKSTSQTDADGDETRSEKAFNDPNFYENEKDATKSNERRETQESRERVRHNNASGGVSVAAVQKEIKMREYSLHRRVMNDIINNITSKIY